MKKIYFLLLCILVCLNLSAQPTTQEQIDRYFREMAQQSPAPGFSVVVVKGEEVLFQKGYGREQIDQPNPMRAESVTAIGSLTKSFTALAIMQLVEAGKIKLDDPVVKYLPEFRTANPDKSQGITVRMLLNNSSGLPGGVSQHYSKKHTEALLASVQAFYLDKEPGKTYEYSNLAFSIAGLIIERVSGLAYAEYLEFHIFQPLRMNHSSTDPADFSALETLYGHHLGVDAALPASPEIELAEMAAAGSILRSTAADLGHYLIALLNQGKYQRQSLISAQSIQEMWQAQINFPGLSYEQGGDGQEYHYGLGWMISDIEGRRLIHHGGSRGTMSSFTLLFPEAKLAATILFNIDYNNVDPYSFASPFQILNNLFHLLLQKPLSDFGRPRIADPTRNNFKLSNTAYQQYTGLYHFGGKGDRRNFQGTRLDLFQDSEGTLAAKIYRGKQLLSHFELDFVNPTQAISRNLAASQPISFVIRPDGSVSSLFYGNSLFRKEAPAFRQKNTEITIGATRFYFPKDWSWEINDPTFSARNSKERSMHLLGGIQSPITQSSPIELLQKVVPDQEVTFSGLEHREVRGTYLWRQQSFRSQNAGRSSQHLILQNETTGFYLLISTADGQLVTQTQQLAVLLLDTYGATP
jgi:CubicO group peptidase (beta-lactamase class C family)